jgi:hypothetical protein
MRKAYRVLVLSSIFCALFALGQDQPSLGDAARQARQDKQQKSAPANDGKSKDGQSKDGQSKGSPSKASQPAKAPRVITNDEIPEHATATAASADQPRGISDSPSPSGGGKMSPEHWKSQILAQKNVVSSMQREMERLNDSIRFAPANCSANCVQWNQRQREKQQEVERMQAQLEEQKKKLEDMQESARRQGYGSSVYDP